MHGNTVILVAEDDACDAILLKLAFRRSEQKPMVHFVQNGEEVLAYLSGTSPYEDREVYPLPDVLLLDLKMPRVDGYEVLEWLASRSEFRDIAVGVLSGMEGNVNIQRAFDLGASFYLIKPNDPAELAGLVGNVIERANTSKAEFAGGFARVNA